MCATFALLVSGNTLVYYVQDNTMDELRYVVRCSRQSSPWPFGCVVALLIKDAAVLFALPVSLGHHQAGLPLSVRFAVRDRRSSCLIISG
jgi:hypothetical protein